MSLILDALRKADAERERGAVPGLHAQPMPLPASEGRARARSLPWLWLAIGALAVLAAALAWRVAGRVESRSLVEATAAAPPPAAAASAAAATTTTPAAPPAAPPAANPPGTPTASAPPQFVAEPAPWPTQDSRKPAVPEPVPAAKRAASAAPAEAAVAPVPAPAPVAAAAAEPPVYAREQLPPQIRAELPPLAFGGAIYSSNPADRSLIVNGRLLRENDRLTGELTLEQIRLKAAVFRYKGYRFEVGF